MASDVSGSPGPGTFMAGGRRRCDGQPGPQHIPERPELGQVGGPSPIRTGWAFSYPSSQCASISGIRRSPATRYTGCACSAGPLTAWLSQSSSLAAS